MANTQIAPGKVSYTDAIEVDGYLRDKMNQEAAIQQKQVQTAHEALSQDVAPVASLANPYAAEVTPEMRQTLGVRAPNQPIPDTSALETPIETKASGYQMDMGRMMAAATPLLVDFLMGPGNGQGTEIAAKAFLAEGTPDSTKAKSNNELEIQRLKLAAEKIKAAKAGMTGTGKPLNKNQVATFLKPDGTKALSTWDEAIKNGWKLSPEDSQAALIKTSEVGDYFVPNKGWMKVTHSEALRQGYKPLDPSVPRYNQTVSVDKALDRESREKIAAMKAKEMKDKGASQKEIQAFNSFSSATSKYNKAEQDVWSVKNAMDVLNGGGVIGEGGIPTMVAKSIFKEVGNLSETDLKMAKGSPAIAAMARRFGSKTFDGQPLTPEDRRDLAILFKVAYTHSANKARTIAEQTKKGYSAMGMKNIQEGIDAYVNIPDLPELTAAVPPTQPAPERPRPNRAAVSILDKKPGSVKVTRLSDGKSLQMDPEKAKTLDKTKYKIGD